MINRLATDRFLKKLDRIDTGHVTVTTPDGKIRDFVGQKPGPSANIILKDWRVPANIAQKGDVGLAENYRDDMWETDNLEALISLAIQNENALKDYVFGSYMSRMTEMVGYFFRRNSVNGSRKNIHAHYDLGNEFYKLWLDPTMTYSSALYQTGDEDLVTAQNQKYDRMLDCTCLESGSILEIGCGWGGFADRAMQRGDFDVKGITLSDEQHDYANQRLSGKNANIVLEDYRHQKGKFDSIVSIEMFEAVGEKYWQTYFDNIASLLNQKGKAVIQTITMSDSHFDTYRKGSDFIRSYIFPGGMLPSVDAFKTHAEKAGLKVDGTFMFGKDYARTLREWLVTFDSKVEAVKKLGFDDQFIRMWRFYLAACAAGFETGRTNVMQAELVRA
jgi:cyclopropane-fatty-acyl-phospholipid synthase